MDELRFTHRMPKQLVEVVDAYAASAGLTRIATINILLSQSLGTVPVPAQVQRTAA